MNRCPDIVLLVLDTQRADRLSCYERKNGSQNGSKNGHQTTPHLDAFAEDATLFRHAFSAAQWTIPSHASMFTGAYPFDHGTLQSYSKLPDDMPTLAERLHDGGYFTTAFCNNALVGVINHGMRRGFDSFLNYSGVFTSRPNQPGGHNLARFDRFRQWFKNQLVSILSHIQDMFARSEALLMLSFTPFMVPLWQTALSIKGNTAKSLNDAARMLIERPGVERGKPIFSFINLMNAHTPYHPPHRFIKRFAPQVIQNKAAQSYLRKFNSDIYGWNTPLIGYDEEHKAILNGMYNAEVASQDEHVGEFIRKLQASGRLENTLLIICSDHGEHLGEKQLLGHAFSTYNELVRVPLIIRDPRGDLPRQTTVDQFLSTRRLFHTILDSAGVASDEERALSMAQSPDSDPDEGTVFVEAEPQQQVVNMLRRRRPDLVNDHGCAETRNAVFSGSYKLIQTGDDQVELYNIVDDPDEQVNLCDILPEEAEDLQERLDRFMGRSRAAMTHENRQEQGVAGGFDDPKVRRRLHDLGYLE